jgi:C-terminal associated domain of TOPRIM
MALHVCCFNAPSLHRGRVSLPALMRTGLAPAPAAALALAACRRNMAHPLGVQVAFQMKLELELQLAVELELELELALALARRSFFTVPEYEMWRAGPGAAQRGWSIKYYKGLGTSTAKEAKEYFAKIDSHQVRHVDMRRFNNMPCAAAVIVEWRQVSRCQGMQHSVLTIRCRRRCRLRARTTASPPPLPCTHNAAAPPPPRMRRRRRCPHACCRYPLSGRTTRATATWWTCSLPRSAPATARRGCAASSPGPT